jgi:hypothetical protein
MSEFFVGLGSFAIHINCFRVNEVGQANLSPADALTLWNQYIRPLKAKGVILGGPSFSSRPNGNDWMLQFLKLCGGDTHCDVRSNISSCSAHQTHRPRFLDRFLPHPFLRYHHREVRNLRRECLRIARIEIIAHHTTFRTIGVAQFPGVLSGLPNTLAR